MKSTATSALRSPKHLQPPHAHQHHHHAAPLQLPGLPRFHPANFPSQDSTPLHSPASSLNSPQGAIPTSPRQQSRQISEAQRQLFFYQRDIINVVRSGCNSRSSSRLGSPQLKPTSPRLAPLGSPGPVTPLELEEHEGYFLAGGVKSALSESKQDQVIEYMKQKEQQRRRDDRRGSNSSSSGLSRRT